MKDAFVTTAVNNLAVPSANRAYPSLFAGAMAANTSPLAQLQRFQSALNGSAGAASANTGSTAVSLSSEALARAGTPERAGALGNAAIGTAQDVLGAFARSLFGDAADGMTLAFDSASVSADSSYASLLQHSSGAQGTRDSAALAIDESADFIGRGHITTADGQVMTFEVEVHYQSHLHASETALSNHGDADTADGDDDGNADAKTNDKAANTPLSLNFPGTLADLLGMVAHDQLQRVFKAPDTTADDAATQIGKLSMRLLDLIKTPQSLAGQLAKVYGLPADPASPLATPATMPTTPTAAPLPADALA